MTYKACACGADHTLAEWLRLPVVGRQCWPGEPVLEMRNCACGSTLAVELPARPSVPPPRTHGRWA